MLDRFLSVSPARSVEIINRTLHQAVRLGKPPLAQFEAVVEIDQDTPVIRNGRGGTELDTLRWGFPAKSLTNRNGWNPPIATIRNLEDRWWRVLNQPYLTDPRYRCLVPFTAFAAMAGRRRKWLRLEQGQGCFAAIWRPWEGESRLVSQGAGERIRTLARLNLFAILEARPSGPGKQAHANALPVILTHPAELAAWMACEEESLEFRPVPLDAFREIADPSRQLEDAV